MAARGWHEAVCAQVVESEFVGLLMVLAQQLTLVARWYLVEKLPCACSLRSGVCRDQTSAAVQSFDPNGPVVWSLEWGSCSQLQCGVWLG